MVQICDKLIFNMVPHYPHYFPGAAGGEKVFGVFFLLMTVQTQIVFLKEKKLPGSFKKEHPNTPVW